MNSGWSSRWFEINLFPMFISPCKNDAGSAIGTAVDAMRHSRAMLKSNGNLFRPAFHI
ncbi:hypothetical protein [Mesorhizobium sp. M0119]|uniref:hypothetical protein n=1 Tax=Mesorhizobium sp. M0119 TaxID=2956885 RepID=UPI00333DBA59